MSEEAALGKGAEGDPVSKGLRRAEAGKVPETRHVRWTVELFLIKQRHLSEHQPGTQSAPQSQLGRKRRVPPSQAVAQGAPLTTRPSTPSLTAALWSPATRMHRPPRRATV